MPRPPAGRCAVATGVHAARSCLRKSIHVRSLLRPRVRQYRSPGVHRDRRVQLNNLGIVFLDKLLHEPLHEKCYCRLAVFFGKLGRAPRSVLCRETGDSVEGFCPTVSDYKCLFMVYFEDMLINAVEGDS
jgi:hypothetical protein